MSERLKGRFITFEGGEGAGKTTQAKRLAKRLRDERGETVLVTREPGGSIVGNAIRAILVSNAAQDMDARLDIFEMLQEKNEGGEISEEAKTAFSALLLAPGEVKSSSAEALLHFAARAEHWECALKPMLKKYQWVICDRFTDSTMAYQGYASTRGHAALGRERIEQMAEAAIPGVAPDLTFVLDVDPREGLKRAADRGEDKSTYEFRALAYHQRVRDGFLDIARREPDRCRVVDASLGEDEIAERIWSEVEEYLALPAVS